MSELVLSLFPGLGLLDRAFEEEGFTIVRGPDVLWGGDVRRFHPPRHAFAGIIGGPPCQAFSPLANLVRAKGHEPRFGNLLPEFARCVEEARPEWFLMENVPQARDAAFQSMHCDHADVGRDYGAYAFELDHCHLDAGDGLGLEQERKRMFWFGVRGQEAPDLRRWIRLAALLLPGRAGAVTQTHVDNSPEAKGRVPAVTGAHSGAGRPKGGHLVVYQWQEMLRLQGLPPDFLEHAPFTVKGKRKAVANGVPLPLGRALARAIRQAVGLPLVEATACAGS